MLAKFRFAIILTVLSLAVGLSQTDKVISPEEVLALVNEDRAAHGLDPLVADPVLALAAQAKAQDMLARNYFSHISPDGLDPWHWFEVMNYRYSYAGENLARGFSEAYELETSWMSSPAHRANILSPFYSEVGLAVLTDNNQSVVVQLFGSKDNKLTLRQ